MPIAVRQLNFVYNPKTPYEKHALIDVNLEVNDGEFLNTRSVRKEHLCAASKRACARSKRLCGGQRFRPHAKKEKTAERNAETAARAGGYGIPISGVSAVCLHSRSGRGFRSQNMKLSKEEIDERTKRSDSVGRSGFRRGFGQIPLRAVRRRKAPRCACRSAGDASFGAGAGRTYRRSRPARKKEILDLAVELRNNHGKTIVMISHDMNEVYEYASRVAVFVDGTVKYLMSRGAFQKIRRA